MTGCAFLLPVVAAGLVMNLDGSYVMSATAGVFIGLGMGAEVDVLAYLTSRYFGLRRYGLLFAILISIYSIGVGTGSVVAGASFDSSRVLRPGVDGSRRRLSGRHVVGHHPWAATGAVNDETPPARVSRAGPPRKLITPLSLGTSLVGSSYRQCSHRQPE